MSDTSDSKLQILLDAALENYEKQTGIKLIDHPLTMRLENCHSVDSIMDVLQEQTRAFMKFRGDNGKVKESLERVVHVLHALSTSTTLGEGVGLPFPPAKPIFAAVGILLSAIKDVSSSYDALVDLLQSIEHFLSRLQIYTELPPTAAMRKIVVKIMVELLNTIALATKKIRQSRPLKLVRKTLGENEIESVLQRLDRLTLDEARTTATQTLEVVHGLVQNVRVNMDDNKASVDGIWDALKAMQDLLNKTNESQRKKLQREARKWLSPPDPYQNHNATRESHYEGTSKWFIEGDTFARWKSSGSDSFLWIHGKPGAGKSVVCSTIINIIDDMRKRGLASLGFFYCDSRDDNKKTLRGLVSSLLVQLCDHSDPYSTILFELYSTHGDGSLQASDDALVGCLRNILKYPGQAPVYLIIDGLDECSNTRGMPSPREKVLRFLEKLVDLHLPNLRICITSRPEVDITIALNPLYLCTVILHEENGQKQDIVNYVKSVMHTDPKMKRWRTEDKELAIEVITTKAQGMFRWVYCQLEALRQCLPAGIRKALDESPESLDETYERTLQYISKTNWKFAHRIFQCVAVAVRPLRVAELAEFLAFDFDKGPTPKYRADWRLEDPVGAIVSICSSLVGVVKVDGSEVIQFSHFSVKEYLTSNRLAEGRDTISRFHVSMTPAHTLVAQVCLGILLHLDKSITSDSLETFPLAEYAARNLADHARFTGVSASTQDGMKRLFDPRNPHLAVWVWIFDPDAPWRRSPTSAQVSNPRGSSLHYAALLGLHDLTTFLVIDCSQEVNAVGLDHNRTPLHAASRGGHVAFARFLLEYNADVNARDDNKWTPLHVASQGRRVELAHVLITHGADVNAVDNYNSTPLHLASKDGHVDIAQVLIEHGADLNAQDHSMSTPLHLALRAGCVDLAQLLVEHGADVNSEDNQKSTPLHLTLEDGCTDLSQLLIKHGANVNAQDNQKSTPLHLALKGGHVDFAQLLIEHGADVNAQDNQKSTPLHLALNSRHMELIRVLIEYGADVQDDDKSTALHRASQAGSLETSQHLLLCGADANSRDDDNLTPLHLASRFGHLQVVRTLLTHGALVNAQDESHWTPLHFASHEGHLDVVRELRNEEDNGGLLVTTEHKAHDLIRSLIDHRIDVNMENENQQTPLFLASRNGKLEVVQFLLMSGADSKVDWLKRTPLHVASENGHLDITRLFLDKGADVNARDARLWTPLHIASKTGKLDVVKELLGRGAEVGAYNDLHRTSLHMASQAGHVDVVQLLLRYGADVHIADVDGETALHRAAYHGHLTVTELLLKHGANTRAQSEKGKTPSDLASKKGHYEVVALLIRWGNMVGGAGVLLTVWSSETT